MRIMPTNRFVPKDYLRECDVCGWDYLRSQLLRRWDGALVCKDDYEEKDRQLEKTYNRPKTFIKE